MRSPVGTLTTGLRRLTAVTVGTAYPEWRGIIVDVSGSYTIVGGDDQTAGAGTACYLAAGIVHPLTGTEVVSAAGGSTTITVGY